MSACYRLLRHSSNCYFSLLREARQQLVKDHKDKVEANGIDQQCHALNNSSAGISYKPNPTRVVKE